MKKKILIIDDDKFFCENLKLYLSKYQYNVHISNSGKNGIEICKNFKIDIVLLDQKLPDRNGCTLCPEILKYNEQTKIIFITAFPSFENALSAIKAGAYDYLSKPFEIEELKIIIKKALRITDLEQTEQIQKYKNNKESKTIKLIGNGLSHIKKLVDLASNSNLPVLITGETGTGKNMVAKAIHYHGIYNKKPFISINCSTMNENLIEAELFGYKKGAFTGAINSKKGIFEMADSGTIFLNEIGEIPLNLQSKLLDVLDENQIRRLGSEITKRINIRVIAATNRNIELEVKKNNFREDLYYRLNVIRIHIPPLRDRIDDITDLTYYYIKQISKLTSIKIKNNELKKLKKYHWPGNVRELKNIIERTFFLQYPEQFKPSLLINISNKNKNLKEINKSDNLEKLIDIEKKYITFVLEKLNFNKTKASKVLGISLSTLKRKIKLYNLE